MLLLGRGGSDVAMLLLGRGGLDGTRICVCFEFGYVLRLCCHYVAVLCAPWRTGSVVGRC